MTQLDMPRAHPPAPRPSCPFCNQSATAPAMVLEVFSVEPRLGGHCRCGAVYVIDETGKAGGEALLDGMALACGGDLDRALALDSKVDYQTKKRDYTGGANTLGLGRLRGSSYVRPTAWFVKLKPAE